MLIKWINNQSVGEMQISTTVSQLFCCFLFKQPFSMCLAMAELPSSSNGHNAPKSGQGKSNPELPRYRQIFESLRLQILEGFFEPGRMVPTEAALMRHYGVSRTTVSRAMRDLEQAGFVSRCRGYGTYVNERSKENQVIRLSFFVPWVESDERLPYVEGLIYQRVSRLASEGGNLLSLHGFNSSSGDLRTGMLQAAQRVINDKVDGVLYYPAELPEGDVDLNREVVDRLTEAKVEVVLIDRDLAPYPERSEFMRVGYDNRRSSTALTIHLIETGCKRIAFVGIPEVSTAVTDRLMGYFEAHQIHGLNMAPELVCSVHEEELDEEFCKKLVQEAKPDAIIAKSDRFAAILGRHLNSLNIKVGSDIKLAGFDNDPISELLDVPLTTVCLPIESFASAAYEAIVRRVKKREQRQQQIIIDGNLIIRESTQLSESNGKKAKAAR